MRLDRARSGSFVRAARALLDAGASANTGYYEEERAPEPEWESALYGAAGLARHAELTRRSPESVRALLAAGASVSGVSYPCGYAEVDELLRTARG